MKTAVFYHAGCSVCTAAEQQVAQALDRSKYQVDIVDLGSNKSRIAEAEAVGVKSVPALVIDDLPYHINFGASINDLK